MNRRDLLAQHKVLCDEARDLMLLKNKDYASDDCPFANFSRCEQMGIVSTEKGFMVRMVDKLSRLLNFIQREEFSVTDETLKDTTIDLVNYTVLLYAWLHEKNAKNS